MSESLEERLARVERERKEADRLYNKALTGLDRALQPRPSLPPFPPRYDTAKMQEVNRVWDILPGGPPVIDRSLKGRLRGLVWRLVGPPLDRQREFNASIVDHLNRNVESHLKTQEATERLLALFEDHAARQIEFQALLMQLLQTVTLYIDTKDRSSAGAHDVLNAGLSAVADSWLKRWESLTMREERVSSTIDDLRATTALAQQTALSLKREVERLLATTSGPPTGPAQRGTADTAFETPDLDGFKYLGFQDQFRGSAEDIGRRLAGYLPLFAGLSDIVDVGCGRGEFLERLRERGISARGIDVNNAMIEECRTRGLDVTKADAIGYLSALPDAAIGGLFSAQVVEHLQPDYLMRMLELAAQKIRPGGIIVIETINPACWVAFFESYIRDLTHVRPIHPETLQYLLRVNGFRDVSLAYTSPVAESARLDSVGHAGSDITPAVADIIETFNENVAKLNGRLFAFQDYAAIGRK